MNNCQNRRARLEDAHSENDDPRDGNPPPNTDVVLSLSNVSAMFSISRLRLLTFELLGLTKRRYRSGSQRVYGWADCERIALIIKSQRAGLPLRDVMPVLRASSGNSDVAARRRAMARCMQLIDRVEKRRRLADDALKELQHVCALLAAETSDHERAVNRRP